MRVLMLSWEYPPHLVGGLGAHVAELVPALAAAGVQVTVVTPRWRGGAPVERIGDNAIIYRVEPPVETPSNYYVDAQQTNLTLEQFIEQLWAQEGGFDLIHAHDWLVSFVAIALKKLHKVPLIATMHATERGRGGGQLLGEMAVAINGAEWWLGYEAWRVIATSRYMANEVRNYFELPADKISIVPNGVDAERFDLLRGMNLTGFRNEWALPDEKIVFYVGRMQYEKGLHLLVESANAMLTRGDRVKFILAGRGSMLPPLRQRVTELGLGDRVVFTDYIDDTTRDKLYCVADVAVFPSLYEPFGIVALEAMAARCPVIVSNVGGLGEVVENGVTGIKVPSYNQQVLTDAIAYVLGHPAQAEERAQHAYDIVCRQYTWEHIAHETIEVYVDIASARQRTKWE